MNQWLIDNWVPIVTALVALYAATVATVGIVIAVLAERRVRRLQLAMSKEGVSVTTYLSAPVGRPVVCVEVVNTGQCDVFIHRVTLRHRGSPADQGVHFIRGVGDSSGALRPGEIRTYTSPLTGIGGSESLIPVLNRFREASPDDVWIVVRSNRRELARIEGAEVLRVIDEVLSSTN